ncbi:S-layer homology domain-containing protein [Sporosarcina sp. E16_3]|uniref:S-layer homology domain-containing protein n=1 Tax=Sporosarcina sp. E16_3 TaxID=2789293 RepID=UPI001A9213F6|nr:S-layer homology domain-containing protein [Sporosarcina sp. E16_3]MBO0602563.1 S-layer homology domain-containing protein [Sporosarcina sp. E16_3]
MKKSTYQKLFKASLATTVATGAFVAAVPTFAQAEVAKDVSFKDVKDTHQFYEAIKSLTSRGVISGYEDGTYKPGQQISRAHAAKIMALALNLDTENVVDPGFKDVKKGSPYYGHIAALVQAGIIKGYEDNTFKPAGNLTRAHVAQMLVLGFKLEEEKLSNLPFKDVNNKQWFANHIQTLFSNKITAGTTATTFSPNAFVTRGQVASFIFKSEAVTKVETPEVPVAEQKESTLVNISADKVEFAEGTYTIPAILKDAFSASNLDALKGAVVKYSVMDGMIVGVSAIEIKASGTAEKNLVIDGQGLVFPGNLTINGDYIHLKNLTIKGAFEVGKEAKNSFTAEKVIVEGTTKVSNNAASTAAAQNGVRYSVAATEPTPTIIFIDSTFANVEVTKDGIIIEYKGSTQVKEFILSANVILKAADGITIPKVTIQAGVTAVTIDANVGNLTVNSTDKLTISGTGNIAEVTIESGNEVKVDTTGKVGKLDIKSKDAKISLGDKTKVTNLVLPAGVAAKDIIQDYDKVKGNIENVGGTPVVTPGTGGGTVTPPSAEEVFESAVLAKLAAVTIAPADSGVTVDFSPSTNIFTVTILDADKSTTALAGTGLVEAFTGDSGVTPASVSVIKGQLIALVAGADKLGKLPSSIVINVTLTSGPTIAYTINFNK